MYTEDDLRQAVANGAISAEAADALRQSVKQTRNAPATDEEHFRLINSFNDIFVTIAAVLLLVAMGGIGDALWPVNDGPSPLAGLLIAGAAWGMAEYFTLQRRMALPSIVLLLAFVGGVFATLIGLIVAGFGGDNFGQNQVLAGLLISGAALATAISAWVHWRRFMVPITVAAGAGALAVTAIALIVTAIGPGSMDPSLILPMVFVAGLVIFGFAMRWDMSDRERQTRRSDVAFWLHLLAAPMIAHPIFALIGVTDGDNIGVGAALAVLAVYIAFGLVALAIDRRALLVSALAYVLFALTFLFDRFGAVELNVALTALVIGSALLTLSAFWTPIRRAVVQPLPQDLQARLPITAAAT
jgi:MFS family permease